MNTKLKPPCKVMFHGRKYSLRSLSEANIVMKRKGWKGLVAHIQGFGGTVLVEYRELESMK
jgi:hypothetical protein